ncbi:Protein ENDOSPERM DEFECTIVE like [Actinidia chinensis var. chinensis]|uniref:Protein ENDOSPERM DEFECTIVE like n=1 Tax=Actinidia chinensis var. chinensis TaxID=1590841 RepID=A0A2R6QM43_ACTCC|nr:Protein ENDOSPERM DEFECTIVE like [Actinidia chinensis var. chinensis]
MKGEMADQVQPSTLGYEQQQVAVPPPPPPLPHRRPRVREVSSRFMSSVIVSSTTTNASPGDLHHHVPKSPLPKHTSTPTTQQQHRSRSVQRQHSSQDLEPLCTRADDNILPDTTRSLETPSLGSSPPPHINNRVTVTASAQRKKRLKENGGGRLLDQHSDHFWQSRSRKGGGGGGGGNVTPSISRPDTPIPTLTTARSQNQNQNSVRGVTAAAKLFKSSVNRDTSQEITSFPLDSCSMGNNTRVEKDVIAYPSSPISVQNSRTTTTRSIPDLRSSLPEVDVLSTRLLADRSCTIGSNSSKFSASPCSRSLNLPLSSCSEKTPYVLSKPLSSSLKIGGSLSLPPLPCAKLGVDPRRGRKDFGHQEQMHSLKLLHNHYLQWRYANAKAEASAHAQRRETERELYSLQVKMSVLRDSVKKKRIEFGQLGRTKTLSTVLEAHMSYLDEWSTLEGEYLSSLSGAIHALLNASVQLPFCGNVQVDVREVWEALNSAIKMTESIGVHIHRFMPKAEEIDALISELARVAGGERALMEDCGDLLFNTCTSQVEECSLRGNLIQLHCSNYHQPQ